MTITMPPKRLSKLALQVLACTSCALLAQSAQSHTDSSPATSSTKASTHQPQTTVNGALQVTYRTDDSTSQNLWQIPGILLGGEAHGYERGPALDSANLTIRHVHDNGLYGVIEIGSHSHDGEAEVEFEEVLVGYHLPLPEQNATAVFEAGHLNARFSPFNHQHANEKASSEDHLAYAAFFGGHFTDNGLRAHLTHDSGWTLGIEAWQGNEYPGDGTHAAVDGYVHYELNQDKWKTNAGIWAFQTQSEVRTDQRQTGHSHGTPAKTDTSSVQYGGDSVVFGAFAQLDWNFAEDWHWQTEAEWLAYSERGDIRDESRLAGLKGDYTAGRIYSALRYNKQQIGVQYERLSLKNHLSGSAGPLIAASAGLLNPGQDPEKTTISYNWFAHQNLLVRLEWIYNRTELQSNPYAALGLVWHSRLY